MAAVVGRVRECPLLDVKLTLLSHNLLRGAAGAALLNAELWPPAAFSPARAYPRMIRLQRYPCHKHGVALNQANRVRHCMGNFYSSGMIFYCNLLCFHLERPVRRDRTRLAARLVV
jgi:hypothetical protein